MFHRLSSSLSTFKTLHFNDGLNILVADRTQVSSDTDTRNGVGKSSVIELFHFLLGGRADKGSLASKPELAPYTFSVQLDWPGSASARRIVVSRSGSSRDHVIVDRQISSVEQLSLLEEEHVTNADWQKILEATLFGLSGDHPCVSGRSMLSYYMRRASDHAFNMAIRHYPMQSSTDIAGNLCYLFGLNWRAASEYKEINDKESLRKKLKQAAKDPVLGRIVGNAAELRSQMAVAQQRAELLERQLADFRVVPEYERLKAEADALTGQLRSETDRDVVDQRNLTQLEEAIAEEQAPDSDYVARVYAELGVEFPPSILRSYEDVREFHDSVIRNRRYYLQAEISSIRERMENRRDVLKQIDSRRSEVMSTLERGGALGSFIALQKVLAREQATVATLRDRFEAADALESTDREIRARRVDLQARMSADLAERETAVDLATVLYAEYARALYGEDRKAYLAISADEGGVRFTPHIESDESQGIGSMVIFCFDLAMAVIAHRGNRGPDFLVHDSHLFDGVDSRQISRALQLGAEVASTEGIQYLVSMNSDDLQKAHAHGFNEADHVLPVKLTDAREDGGLFGLRFP